MLSPRQRVLLRDGSPVTLIPKYFDLLLLLVRRRQEAISKQAIFTAVWSDVVVSDGALSQAIRTLRRALDDSPREPRFIRTVSRHGYQFVCADVCEELDEAPLAATGQRTANESRDAVDPLVSRLFAAVNVGAEGLDEAREMAERLHALDTAAALSRIVERPNHAAALAVMRDARWSVAGAGDVPLDPGATLALIRLRLAAAGRTAAGRWAGAAAAGALGGTLAGVLGGIVLNLSPASRASAESPVALAAIGALAGGVGAAGIGAGLAVAETLARSRRGLALTVCGALAGALVAFVAHVILRALLDAVVGVRNIVIPGWIEGLTIGAAIGLGYAVATRQPPGGGMAAPTGVRRWKAVATVGGFTAAAASLIAVCGGILIGGLLNGIAAVSPNAQLMMTPLGRLIGEPDFGPAARTLLSAFEGGAFGAAIAWGLTTRPKSA